MTHTATAFETELITYRPDLMRFARLQLRNEAWAEDAVSETLLAAVAKPQTFGNRSLLKTWLIGILKHKVIDQLRVRSREIALSSDESEDGGAELDALVFHADGHFAQTPAAWGHPEEELHSKQFLAILEACVDKLPAALGRVFLMREWLELSVEEICKEMDLTATNLYVQLHRARLRLRECLDLNWFGNRSSS